MIELYTDRTQLNKKSIDPIPSGIVNALKIRVTFDSSYNDLIKFVVFKCGETTLASMGDTLEYNIPWEILVKQNEGKEILVGVYGSNGTDVILTTNYVSIGKLIKGCDIEDTFSEPPSPSVVQFILDAANQAVNTANEALEVANDEQNIAKQWAGAAEESQQSAAQSLSSAQTATVQANRASSEARDCAESANNSANRSEYYAGQAGFFKNESEAYAIGKRGGDDVPSTDPTYQNNAKYYAEQAETITQGVKYVTQTLTDDQKAQARKNIGAASAENTDFKLSELRQALYGTVTDDVSHTFGSLNISYIPEFVSHGDKKNRVYDGAKLLLAEIKGKTVMQNGMAISAEVTGITVNGFNLWDEEWMNGLYQYDNANYPDGTKTSSPSFICTKNEIEVLPDTDYYFTAPAGSQLKGVSFDENKNFIQMHWNAQNKILHTPSNCRYLGFYEAAAYGASYNHDICFNLYDSKKNGRYESYKNPFTLEFDKQTLKSAGDVADTISVVKKANGLFDIMMTERTQIIEGSVVPRDTPVTSTLLSDLDEWQVTTFVSANNSVSVVGNDNEQVVRPDLQVILQAEKMRDTMTITDKDNEKKYNIKFVLNDGKPTIEYEEI